MLDDPKDPNLSDTPEEPAAESGFLPEPSKPEQMTPGMERPVDESAIRGPGQTEAGEENPPSRAGSVFQRFTGTLRRVTGPLRDTGALTPPENQPAPDMGQLRRANKIMTGRLGDETGNEPAVQQESTNSEEQLPPTEPLSLDEPVILPPIPMPGSRREIPDSGIFNASLPELEEEPSTSLKPDTSFPEDAAAGAEPGAGEEVPPSRLDTGRVFQRLTGTLRRVTGSLRDSGPLPPEEDQPTPDMSHLRRSDQMMTARLGDEPASEPDTSSPETSEEVPPSRLETGGLFQRLSGTMRRVTGTLQDTGPLPPDESQPAPETDQSRRTDPITTQHLSYQPGSEQTVEPIVFEEGQPVPMPESRRQVPDSGIVTAGMPELQEEPEKGPGAEPGADQPRSEGETGTSKSGTGSLIQRVTGTLRRVTGSLRDTGSLQPPAGEPPATGKTGRLPSRRRPTGPDYVSDLRKALTSEEETDRTKRGTGSLIQRFTGRLRKVTGSLRPTDALPPALIEPAAPPAEPEVNQPEIADDFLSDRLTGSQSSELPTFGEEPIQPAPMDESWGEIPQPSFNVGMESAEVLEIEENLRTGARPEPEIYPGDDEPNRLTESEEFATQGRTAENSQEVETDWMAEIRRAAAQPEEQPPAPAADETRDGVKPEPQPPTGDVSGRRGSTGNLRSFITGMLGLSGAKEKQAEETEIPDDMVAGRLGLNPVTEAPPAAGAQELLAEEEGYPSTETGQVPGDETGQAAARPFAEPTAASTEEMISPLAEEESALLEGLEVSFSHIEGLEEEEPTPYEMQPEDEDLLWGGYTAGTDTPAGEDIIIDFAEPEDNIWGSDQPGFTSYGAELRQEIWGDEVAPEVPEEREHIDESGEYVASDEFNAAYFAGEGLAQEGEAEEGVLKQPAGEGEEISPQDLRSIALEDYEEGEFDYDAYKQKIEWGDEAAVLVTEPVAELPVAAEEEKALLRTEVQAEEIAEPVDAGNWRSWLAARKASQKLLLAEGALVVLALLIAVPFFIFMIFRGPASNGGAAVQGQPVVNSPYPTGLTLPGGWYFPLQTSTITKGQWQPSTSEWLVGSELRRVVALPWNKQTEAVIHTFQTGDTVEIQLSDRSMQKYTVSTIERVPVGDTRVFSDIRPSLVIILYEENDSSRWVVVCKP